MAQHLRALAAVPEQPDSVHIQFTQIMAYKPSVRKTEVQRRQIDCQHAHRLKRTKLGFRAMMLGSRAQEPSILPTGLKHHPPQCVKVSFVELTWSRTTWEESLHERLSRSSWTVSMSNGSYPGMLLEIGTAACHCLARGSRAVQSAKMRWALA